MSTECPVEFSEARRAGPHQRLSRFGSAKKLEGWHYSQGSCNSIILSADKNIKLHAVCLFGSENNEYSVVLEVTDPFGFVLATKTGTFLSKHVQTEGGGRDYDGFDVVFEPPIALEGDTRYCFEAFISGPPSWYGQCGKSRVEHAGVTFSFTQKGTPTRITKGQFSDFEFTLN